MLRGFSSYAAAWFPPSSLYTSLSRSADLSYFRERRFVPCLYYFVSCDGRLIRRTDFRVHEGDCCCFFVVGGRERDVRKIETERAGKVFGEVLFLEKLMERAGWCIQSLYWGQLFTQQMKWWNFYSITFSSFIYIYLNKVFFYKFLKNSFSSSLYSSILLFSYNLLAQLDFQCCKGIFQRTRKLEFFHPILATTERFLIYVDIRVPDPIGLREHHPTLILASFRESVSSRVAI